MRRHLALAVALSLTACAQPTRPPECVTNPAAVSATLFEAISLGRVGEQYEQKLTWAPATVCPDQTGENVTSLAAELFDPDNQPLAVGVSVPQRRSDARGTWWEAVVSFVPSRLGPHHLISTFGPEGGLVQLDLWVVERRFGTGFFEAYTAGETCERLERLATRSLLCQREGKGAVLFRDERPVREWPDVVARAAGSAIWFRGTANELGRAVELADGGVEEARLVTEVTNVFAAREDEVLLYQASAIRLLGFDGGVWTEQARVGIPLQSTVAIAWSPDAGNALLGGEHAWRRVGLFGESPDAGSLGNNSVVLHQAPDGLWLLDPTATQAWFAAADARLPLVGVGRPQGWQPVLARGLLPGDRLVMFPVRPPTEGDRPQLDQTEAIVPVLRDGGYQFLHFRAPAGATFLEVSGNTLRATNGANHFFFPLE